MIAHFAFGCYSFAISSDKCDCDSAELDVKLLAEKKFWNSFCVIKDINGLQVVVTADEITIYSRAHTCTYVHTMTTPWLCDDVDDTHSSFWYLGVVDMNCELPILIAFLSFALSKFLDTWDFARRNFDDVTTFRNIFFYFTVYKKIFKDLQKKWFIGYFLETKNFRAKLPIAVLSQR